jgi:hypothetical protein
VGAAGAEPPSEMSETEMDEMAFFDPGYPSDTAVQWWCFVDLGFFWRERFSNIFMHNTILVLTNSN